MKIEFANTILMILYQMFISRTNIPDFVQGHSKVTMTRLFGLLAPEHDLLPAWLLRHFCHRTGKWSRQSMAPLCRLRWALSRLWYAYLPFASGPVMPPDPSPVSWPVTSALLRFF